MKSPVTALIQVCVLAPFVEKVLMRGFLLGGLKEEYGVRTALLVTSLLFAILHFNMVQSVSAFICGMILGLLYLKTKSVLCCMIADRLAENGSTWNKNTVITLLSRLVEKGLLRTSKFGRRNQYKALVSREEYQTGQTENLVDKVFEGNVKGLVANLIRRDMLTPQDYEELYEFWKKGEMQDEGVRKALSEVYPSLQKKGEKSQVPIETPFLSRVRDVSGKTVEELAAESYREEQLTVFSAVFPELKDDEKEMYLNLMYEEEEVSFFAASLRSVSREKIRELNQKAFRDGAANFFVMTFVWMEEDEMVELIQRAYTEGENGMFSVAVGAADLPEESWDALLEQARRERWGSFYVFLLETKMNH